MWFYVDALKDALENTLEKAARDRKVHLFEEDQV